MDMCLRLRRYFIWSSPREKSKSRRSGTRGFASESKANLRSLWFELHTELFFREVCEEFQKRILEMACWSTASEEPRRNYNLELKVRAVSRVQLDFQAAIQEREGPPPTVGEQLPRRIYIRRSVGLARVWVHN